MTTLKSSILPGPSKFFPAPGLLPGQSLAAARTQLRFKSSLSRKPNRVSAVGNLIVEPHYSFSDAPRIDIVVIPGGWGSRKVMQDPEILGWTQRAARTARYTSSVCTGALVLARAGLLAGRRATTHWAAYDLLESLGEGVKVIRDVRVVQDGIFSSAGVSAGIDMAFALVEELCGPSVADETAHYIEYLRR